MVVEREQRRSVNFRFETRIESGGAVLFSKRSHLEEQSLAMFCLETLAGEAERTGRVRNLSSQSKGDLPDRNLPTCYRR